MLAGVSESDDFMRGQRSLPAGGRGYRRGERSLPGQVGGDEIVAPRVQGVALR